MSTTTIGAYVVEIETGESMSLNTLKIGKTVGAVIKFDADGKVAWRGPRYWVSHAPSNMKAHAGKMRKRYQAYFERTGNRFEVEQEAERAAKEAAKKAEIAARKAIKDAAPELFEALKIARRIVAKAVKDGSEPENALRTIDAALAKAAGK